MLNEMMHRPVVMQKIIDLMREGQVPFEGVVGQLEAFASTNPGNRDRHWLFG